MAARICCSTSLQAIFMAVLMLTIGSNVVSNAQDISIYWGHTKSEGSLAEICATTYNRNAPLVYDIVNLAFLDTFGGGRVPRLNLGTHCTSYNSTSCSNITWDIWSCQSHGIKVFLTIGGPYNGSYTLSSRADAKQLAVYLWNNFLGGKSSSRPLGPAILDGINFDIQGGDGLYWDILAKYLSKYRTNGTKVYLTAAPKCSFPDPLHGKAINTGLFDYVWPRFFNDSSCQFQIQGGYDYDYDKYYTNLINEWKVWTSRITASKIFLGITSDVEVPGYVSLCSIGWLINQLRNSSNSNYGGVTIWTNEDAQRVKFYALRLPGGECP